MMQVTITSQSWKDMARRLATFIQDNPKDTFQHSHAREAVARMLGYKNRNVMAAALNDDQDAIDIEALARDFLEAMIARDTTLLQYAWNRSSCTPTLSFLNGHIIEETEALPAAQQAARHLRDAATQASDGFTRARWGTIANKPHLLPDGVSGLIISAPLSLTEDDAFLIIRPTITPSGLPLAVSCWAYGESVAAEMIWTRNPTNDMFWRKKAALLIAGLVAQLAGTTKPDAMHDALLDEINRIDQITNMGDVPHRPPGLDHLDPHQVRRLDRQIYQGILTTPGKTLGGVLATASDAILVHQKRQLAA